MDLLRSVLHTNYALDVGSVPLRELKNKKDHVLTEGRKRWRLTDFFLPCLLIQGAPSSVAVY